MSSKRFKFICIKSFFIWKFPRRTSLKIPSFCHFYPITDLHFRIQKSSQTHALSWMSNWSCMISWKLNKQNKILRRKISAHFFLSQQKRARRRKKGKLSRNLYYFSPCTCYTKAVLWECYQLQLDCKKVSVLFQSKRPKAWKK